MSDSCEVVAYLKSRRVPAGFAVVHVPVSRPYGFPSAAPAYMPMREIAGEDRWEPTQEAAFREARRQAEASGFAFRVVDVRRLSPLRRLLLARALSVREFPVILWKGPCAVARLPAATDARAANPEVVS